VFFYFWRRSFYFRLFELVDGFFDTENNEITVMETKDLLCHAGEQAGHTLSSCFVVASALVLLLGEIDLTQLLSSRVSDSSDISSRVSQDGSSSCSASAELGECQPALRKK
jgi:hypothetical protein